jgi:hypothetical protein
MLMKRGSSHSRSNLKIKKVIFDVPAEVVQHENCSFILVGDKNSSRDVLDFLILRPALTWGLGAASYI